MTEHVRRSSWQSFDVSEVDAGIVAAAFARSPEDGAKALTVLASKHHRAGRLAELDRLGGDVTALAEAVRERARSVERVEQLAKDVAERIRLAKAQALDPRREDGA